MNVLEMIRLQLSPEGVKEQTRHTWQAGAMLRVFVLPAGEQVRALLGALQPLTHLVNTASQCKLAFTSFVLYLNNFRCRSVFYFPASSFKSFFKSSTALSTHSFTEALLA